MRKLCLALLLALLPALAAAQDSTWAVQPDVQPDVQPKDPGVATVYGTVLLGGGHLYSREYWKAVGLWVAGPGLFGSGYYTLQNRGDNTVLYVGIATTALAWMISIFDANNAAQRFNRRHGFRDFTLAVGNRRVKVSITF